LAQEATRTAVAQAEAVATAAGTHVIGVREVNVEPSGIVRPMPMMRMAMGAAEKTVSRGTEAGEQDISVNVSVKLTVSK